MLRPEKPLASYGASTHDGQPLQLVVCAAPAYLAAHGTPVGPAELAAHNCLDYAYAAEPLIWRFKGEGDAAAVDVGGNLRINSGPALRTAALGGIGIVMQPNVVVAGDLTAGRLVRLLPNHAAPALRLHFLTPPNRRPTLKLRSLMDHLVAEFSRRRPRASSPSGHSGDE